ncbi:hypothetical protein [Paraflavitalea devenefica]|uniref:hypothetical protein n=1 Tax=Paraflavitalea devenefica TaxID=2716334 RepID=UPI0014246581|nr:hypothetical protein [Paraflavitalea devenefica]
MLFACNPKSNDKDIQIQKIIVKTGAHAKIDLEKETYTVYFMNGKSYDCKFTLSDQEKTDIFKTAQVCGLAKLKGTIQVEDNCDMFPKVYTKLSFIAGSNNVQVSIDRGCNKHPLFKQGESEDIIKFLTFLHKKIASKPEVVRAPKTDIRYM